MSHFGQGRETGSGLKRATRNQDPMSFTPELYVGEFPILQTPPDRGSGQTAVRHEFIDCQEIPFHSVAPRIQTRVPAHWHSRLNLSRRDAGGRGETFRMFFPRIHFVAKKRSEGIKPGLIPSPM